MSAITISNTLPKVLIALSEESLNLVDQLTHEAFAATIENDEQATAADKLLKKIDQLTKAIEEQRKTVTRPIDALKKQLIDAECLATVPLTEAWTKLGANLKAYVDAARARAAEAERVAREQQRLEQEAENRRADAARAEIERLAKEQAEFDAPPGEAPAPVEVSVFVEPPKAVAPAYVAPAFKSAALRAKTEQTLVIDRAELVPAVCGGVEVRPIDQGALKRYLKMLPPGRRQVVVDGVVVAHLVEVESFAAKG